MSRRLLAGAVAGGIVLAGAWWLRTAPAPTADPVATQRAEVPVAPAPAVRLPRTVRLTRPEPEPPVAPPPDRPVEPETPRRRTLSDLDEAERAERLAFWEQQALQQLLDDCLGGIDDWDPAAVSAGRGMQVSTVVDDQGLNEIGLGLHGDVAENAEELQACLQDSAWDLDWLPFERGELLEQTTVLLGPRADDMPSWPHPIPDPPPVLYFVDGEYLSEEAYLERQGQR